MFESKFTRLYIKRLLYTENEKEHNYTISFYEYYYMKRYKEYMYVFFSNNNNRNIVSWTGIVELLQIFFVNK